MMEAFVEHKFENGFLLDEEKLRKISGIITARLGQAGINSCPQFKVYRADTFTYTTDSLEVLLAEENSGWQRIKRIAILAPADNDLLLNLDFDEGRTNLHIEGRNRDAVFLLFSELRQYIGTEVNILTRRLERFVHYLPLILGFTVLVFMLIAVATDIRSLLPDPYSISRESALASPSIELKLNFLIERQFNVGDPFENNRRVLQIAVPAFLVMAAALVLIIGQTQARQLIRRFYPDYLFLFGKEIEKHRKREAQREKIVWGVIISFAISFIAGAALWVFTK